jgi:hypothetical protein
MFLTAIEARRNVRKGGSRKNPKPMTPTAPKVLKPASMPPPGFVAKLNGAKLVDLIQMECLRGTRQVVRVSTSDARGFLFFDAGQLVHAVCGRFIGENAVFEMLRWGDGSFEACDASWPGQTSISVGWQFLLIEAMRRGDEAERDLEPSSEEPASQEIEVQSRPGAGAPATEPTTIGKAASMAASNETDATKYGVIRAVRFEEDGQVISHLGQVGDLADISAYALRLARILGETLGVGPLVGLESRVDDKSLFLFLDEETVVAVEALSDSNVASYRKKAGF